MQACAIFQDRNYLDFVDERRDYGEERHIRPDVIPLPPVDKGVIVLVTRSGNRIHLVSAGMANARGQLPYNERG